MRLDIILHRLVWVGLVAASLAVASTARAIPAFARQFHTSCDMCHTAFPDLNPTGEAFRRLGYRMPMGHMEAAPETVPLGESASDFPSETFPGELLAQAPIAAFISTGVSMQRGMPIEDDTSPVQAAAPRDDWALTHGGTELALLLAGPLGDRISFFGELATSGGAIELERATLTFGLLPPPLLMVTVGKLIPTLNPFIADRTVLMDSFVFNTITLGANEWSPNNGDFGVEASGVLFHRLSWFAGIMEGSGGALDAQKDYYGRLTYKLGGLASDGTGSSDHSHLWREYSAALGTSAYRGSALLTDVDALGMPIEQRDSFWRAAVDLDVRLRDLHLVVSGFTQRDEHPMVGDAGAGTLDGLLAEAEYVVFPWLIPTVRYMLFSEDLPGAGAHGGHRLLAGVTALVRENIRVSLFGEGRTDAGNGFHVATLSLRLMAGF